MEEAQQINTDVIVECYLDAKYYHHDAVELNDLADFNAELVNLIAVVDEHNLSASVDENFKGLENACPSWEHADTQAVNPKWIEHHQYGHLTKDKNCPVCEKKLAAGWPNWRKKADRKPGVMHLDLAAFEPSANGPLLLGCCRDN